MSSAWFQRSKKRSSRRSPPPSISGHVSEEDRIGTEIEPESGPILPSEKEWNSSRNSSITNSSNGRKDYPVVDESAEKSAISSTNPPIRNSSIAAIHGRAFARGPFLGNVP
jgi:hypothetical protein